MYRSFSRLAVLSLLLLGISAFAALALPLASVEGIWRLDIQATIQKTQDEGLRNSLRDEAANGPFAHMTLKVDGKGRTITLAMPGEESEIIGFAVEREEGAILVLTTEDSSSLQMELQSDDSLAVGAVSDDGSKVKHVLYFRR